MSYDVIVVGARCAGSSSAMLLARLGLRVLVVDRSTFPSDTLSGHGIKSPGTVRLARWGLLDTVLASGCPRMTRMSVTFGDQRQETPTLPADAVTPAGPRRFVLDQVLVDAAGRAGAEVRQGWSLTGLTRQGERVTGVRLRAPDGRMWAESAELVVGADGRNSLVAKLVGAPTYLDLPPSSVAYYGYWRNLPADGLDIWFGQDSVAGIFPTNDDESVVWVQSPVRNRATFRRAVTETYLRTVRSFPEAAARIADAVPQRRVVGMSRLPNFFRAAHGPGWALVGDAGHHKDPLVARGISDAFRDAELLAEAMRASMAGDLPLSRSLAEFQRVRDLTSRRIYELNAELAKLSRPLGELADLWQRLAVAEEAADRLLSVSLSSVG